MESNKGYNFNIWAAIFGPLYYIYKGLWKKGLILSSLILIVIGVAELLFPTASLNWVTIGLNVGVYGALANFDINRKEQFNEKMWKELPPVFNLNWVVILIFAISFIFSIATDNGSTTEIEDASVDIVTDILHNQFNIPLDAIDVMIVNESETAENTYEARATLSNNTVINISIEYYPDKDNLYVYIPYEEVMYIH